MHMYIYNRIIRITVKAWLYYFNKLLPLGIFKKKYSHNCLVVNHFVYMEAAFYARVPCLSQVVVMATLNQYYSNFFVVSVNNSPLAKISQYIGIHT